MYNGNDSPDDEAMFLTERHCFFDLLEGVASVCDCGLSLKPWVLESVVQVCGQICSTPSLSYHSHVERACSSSDALLPKMSLEKNLVKF